MKEIWPKPFITIKTAKETNQQRWYCKCCEGSTWMRHFEKAEE